MTMTVYNRQQTYMAPAACHSTDSTVGHHLASWHGRLRQLLDLSASSANVTDQLESAVQVQLPVAGSPAHIKLKLVVQISKYQNSHF